MALTCLSLAIIIPPTSQLTSGKLPTVNWTLVPRLSDNELMDDESANQLIQSPKVYATMLWRLLAQLFEDLPEVGDLDKSKLMFFFDEAHLLFEDAPVALQDKTRHVVQLIRSAARGGAVDLVLC